MKTRQLGFTVAGIVALVIAFLVGRHLQTTPKTVRVVTISASPQAGCEVDFPVASLRENVHQIKWQSNDRQYWVMFNPLATGETPPNGYTPVSPLVGQPDKVIVPANGSAGPFDVKFNQGHCLNGKCPDYYIYDIYDPNTSTTTPCKDGTIDRDTGVIVKR